jgi:hypothetical protein
VPDPKYPVLPVASGQTAGYTGSPDTFEPFDAGDTNTADLTGPGAVYLTSPIAQSDVTGLVTALAGKQATGSYLTSPIAISDVTALQGDLDAKADAAETFYGYDFAIDGGAQGTISLHGPAIPLNAYVNAAFYQIITPFTSGGLATVALTSGQAAGDVATAAAFDNAKYATGVHTAAVHQLTTGSKQPAIVIAVADLTAGKIKVFFDISEGWG